ncbi:MAG TPA: phage/plasmid primase, P4 family, partial [Accumulibacter sp.]|nr:phage/plasmid primase, P4 family [Accumulibacter sp.]
MFTSEVSHEGGGGVKGFRAGANGVDRVPVLEVAEALGLPIKRSGGASYIGCPASAHEHDAERPRCELGGDKPALFFCHKCGAAGDAVGLVKLVQDCDAATAFDWLRAHRFLPQDGNHRRATPADPLERWAAARDFEIATLRAFDITGERGEVFIPERDESGAVIGRVRRRADGTRYSSGDKSLSVKGSKRGLTYSPADLEAGAAAGETLAITEGGPDTLRFRDCGHRAVIGVPSVRPGSRVCAGVAHLAARYGFKRAVIFADPGGLIMRDAVGKALAAAGLAVAWVVPDPDVDTDGRLRHLPRAERPAELARLIEAALPWTSPAGEADDAADAPAGAPDATGPRPLTDLGNAERFAAQHKGRLLFDVRCNAWRVWDGKRWRLDTTGEAMRRAAQTVRNIYREAAAAADSKQREALANWAKSSESRMRLTALVALAQGLLVIEPDQWDADPWALNVNNGMVDLRTGRLRPHNPADHCTRLAPVDFIEGATHPVLDKVLKEAIPDPEERDFTQRIFGYSLSGEKYEKAVAFVYGPKDTAKSTLVEPVMKALGEYAVTVEPEILMKRDFSNGGGPSPEIARLDGARLVGTSETAEGQKLNSGLVKRISGGGARLTARECHANTREFDVTFLLLFQSNYRPRVAADDDAFFTRLKVIPFDVVIPRDRRDPRIKQTLESDPAAQSAILWWLVEGCLAWQREGLREPAAVTAATGKYQDEMDPLSGFFDDCCRFSPDARATAKELREAYENWAKGEGLKERYLVSSKVFGSRLTARGCISGKVNRERGWIGIELSDGTDGTDGTDSPGLFPYIRDCLEETTAKRPKRPMCPTGGTELDRELDEVMAGAQWFADWSAPERATWARSVLAASNG